MSGRPDLSVVIPTRRRWDVLSGTLEVLGAQSQSEFAVEVVVVNNGSGPAPALANSAHSVTVVDEPRPGDGDGHARISTLADCGVRGVRKDPIVKLHRSRHESHGAAQ